jgi:hypothetical protein
MIMETNISTKLERYKELAGKVSNYMDKAEKKTAFENILNNINSLIPATISNNLQEIQRYTKFYFQDYRVCEYRFGDNTVNLIRFINDDFREIQDFENDNKETRKERKIKSDQLRQVIIPKEEKIYSNSMVRAEGASNYVRPLLGTKPNPEWIYTQYGTYTKYLSFKLHRYFPICLNIKKSGCFDFEAVNYLVLLYIALNNELSIINEELELLGIIPRKQSSQPGTNIDKVNDGEPQQNFTDYLHHNNKSALMLKLHELLDMKNSGREAAKVLLALENKNYLIRNSYKTKSVIAEFRLNCSRQAITSFTSENAAKPIPQTEIQQIIDMLP